MEIEVPVKRGRGRPRKYNYTDPKQYYKEYYHTHKDKYNKPVQCEICNKTVVHIKPHRKTKKHMLALEAISSCDMNHKEADIEPVSYENYGSPQTLPPESTSHIAQQYP